MALGWHPGRKLSGWGHVEADPVSALREVCFRERVAVPEVPRVDGENSSNHRRGAGQARGEARQEEDAVPAVSALCRASRADCAVLQLGGPGRIRCYLVPPSGTQLGAAEQTIFRCDQGGEDPDLPERGPRSHQ